MENFKTTPESDRFANKVLAETRPILVMDALLSAKPPSEEEEDPTEDEGDGSTDPSNDTSERTPNGKL